VSIGTILIIILVVILLGGGGGYYYGGGYPPRSRGWPRSLRGLETHPRGGCRTHAYAEGERVNGSTHLRILAAI